MNEATTVGFYLFITHYGQLTIIIASTAKKKNATSWVSQTQGMAFVWVSRLSVLMGPGGGAPG